MENYELGVKVSIITIIINIVLSAAKIIAGVIGQSSAMLADGVHTLSDVLTTLVVLLGLKISSKEADENHPYGHEKYEPVFAKILSIFLAVTGILIGYEGIKILITGEIKTPGTIALIAALISIITKEGMFWYTIKAAKKVKSFSMEADAWHHRTDAMSSIGTFVGILGARMGLRILDPIAAIIVSLFIIKVGIDLYLQSIKGLVDEAADDEIIEKIRELAFSVEGVKDIKNLKTRIFGNRIYVDVDILVNGTLTVIEGHEIAEKVHDLIEKSIDDVKHCMVHVEPEIGTKK
ncbi:Cation diffusion facilitator family transporter [[Clostridium] ultunense Esp]|uniref:Cation diffusion facilitator family transporter n=1 Tax=[Clostridium] ultunense Esp TaxID=1288971 RepID=M1Z3E7_9FIRM|nr:cation diffusion facilitator family transporter [Schnuerera ultunensis]CCQ92561.1 Cation diffusion facilitator family transporter [[Clostridium] ultunense Esp]SHD77332.1 Cation diffusion facilitator family transporter [[Clostridium] ultunense Esp]